MFIVSKLANKCLKNIYFCNNILLFNKLCNPNKTFDRGNSADSFKHFDKDVVQMLQKRKYLHLDPENMTNTVGLMGQETMNNWKSEWWRYFVVGKNSMIGIEVRESSNGEIEDKEICTEIIFKYLMKKKSVKPIELSFGIAVNVVEQIDSRNLIENLVQVIFVKNASELDVESWNSKTMKWIKTYLRRPARCTSKFGEKSLTDVASKKDIFTHYKYEDTSCLVQTASLFSAECFNNHSEWALICRMFNSTPSVIVIRHKLTNLLKVTLADAFHIVSFPNYRHQMLRMHPYLTPVKAAVCIEGEKCSKLKQLASELTHLIRCMNASCWNAAEEKLSYSDLDESAVVHGIIISKETLETGILHIRNRDTSLKIQAHISELQDKLFLYLDPK